MLKQYYNEKFLEAVGVPFEELKEIQKIAIRGSIGFAIYRMEKEGTKFDEIILNEIKQFKQKKQ